MHGLTTSKLCLTTTIQNSICESWQITEPWGEEEGGSCKGFSIALMYFRVISVSETKMEMADYTRPLLN